MAWTIDYSAPAKRRLKKLDRQVSRAILDYMDLRIGLADDPRAFGEPLTGNLAGLWRYRVQDYRILCKLEDNILTVLVIEIGHRREVYR